MRKILYLIISTALLMTFASTGCARYIFNDPIATAPTRNVGQPQIRQSNPEAEYELHRRVEETAKQHRTFRRQVNSEQKRVSRHRTTSIHNRASQPQRRQPQATPPVRQSNLTPSDVSSTPQSNPVPPAGPSVPQPNTAPPAAPPIPQPNTAPQPTPAAPQNHELSSHETEFSTKDEGRSINITRAAESINGKVVQPGEVFSFNETVGPTIERRGYKQSTVYVQGKKSKGFGGGVCQVSTTLHQAAEEADMTILERHDHSLPVGYAKSGEEAATSYGVLDFKFQNDKTHPVKIVSHVQDGKLNVKIQAV